MKNRRTNVQWIHRSLSQRWSVDVPQAIVQELKLEKGEEVEWVVKDQGHLMLRRSSSERNAEGLKKKTDRS